MTIAELHGKLSASIADDRSEDLLTSDVFGTMRYLNGGHGFVDWIASARTPFEDPDNPRMLGALMGSLASYGIDYAFWPTLPNGREPDLALLVSRRARDPLLLCIEAKYFSGMSDIEVSEADVRKLTGNQIADQVHGLTDISPQTLAEWFGPDKFSRPADVAHVLVTADSRIPIEVFDEASRHLPDPWPAPAFWLSWGTLTRFLAGSPRSTDAGLIALVDDLVNLLERKGLVPFSGFHELRVDAGPDRVRFWKEQWWCLPFLPERAATFWLSHSDK